MTKKQSLYKCSRCGRFRQESSYEINSKGNRNSACAFCSRSRASSTHGEKTAIIARECGVCGKPMRNPSSSGGWLCPDHIKKNKRKRSDTDSLCNSCNHLKRCNKRIHSAIWVLCELPGLGDIDRVRAMLHDQNMTPESIIKYVRKNY